MKRAMLGALCAVLLLLFGCGQQKSLTTSPSIDEKDTPITTAPEAVEPSSIPTPQEDIDISELSPLQAFTAVLQNEIPFLYIDQDRGETHQGVSYMLVYQITERLDELTKDDKKTMSMPSFTVVDMDGDGLGEVVFQRSDYIGYIVLRYTNDQVIGYSVNYRAMHDLKEDGSFLGTGGAMISYIEKLRFLGEYFDNDCLANQYGESYWILGEPATKEDYVRVADEFNMKPNARWRVYSQDAINMWLERDLNEQSNDAISENAIAERQTLLNSFSNLLWFNYNTREAYVSRADNSKRYYDDWNTAMEDLQTRCMDEMSIDEKSTLHDDQQRWLEVRKKEEGAFAEADPATRDYHLGRMTQLRVYHLVSLYCNDRFCDMKHYTEPMTTFYMEETDADSFNTTGSAPSGSSEGTDKPVGIEVTKDSLFWNIDVDKPTGELGGILRHIPDIDVPFSSVVNCIKEEMYYDFSESFVPWLNHQGTSLNDDELLKTFADNDLWGFVSSSRIGDVTYRYVSIGYIRQGWAESPIAYAYLEKIQGSNTEIFTLFEISPVLTDEVVMAQSPESGLMLTIVGNREHGRYSHTIDIFGYNLLENSLTLAHIDDYAYEIAPQADSVLLLSDGFRVLGTISESDGRLTAWQPYSWTCVDGTIFIYDENDNEQLRITR